MSQVKMKKKEVSVEGSSRTVLVFSVQDKLTHPEKRLRSKEGLNYSFMSAVW